MSALAMEALQHLPGFRATGKQQWEARCPAHEDRKASLAISTGNDDKILLHCFAGCDLPRILEAAGIDAKDLFASNGHEPQERRIVATYDYQTAAGELSYQVVRYEPKDFRQRKPDGNGGWIWKTGDLKRLPYHLPELAGAEYVSVVEGEKDVDAFRGLGQAATCNSGGAGKWTAELSQHFNPRQHVTIIPDNDEPGRKHAQQVAASLFGKVASVKILDLPGLPEKGDVSDWLEGRDPEAAAEELSRLAEAAPEWDPAEPIQQEPGAAFIPPEYWRQFDVADVHNWKCPDLEPLIEGILAKGNLCWLAAETQTGKTLFMLWVCLQLLHKGKLFDRFMVTPVNRILYVACEDPARRFKSRLLDMMTAAVEAGRFVVYVAPGLSLVDVLCFQFLEKMIQDGGFDLVVIDTFQAATMGISSFDDEKLSIVIQHLLGITRKLGTTIVVNDHFRKTQVHKKRSDLDLNDVKGSGGKLQNADVFLLMDRHNGQLRISGRSKEWDRSIGFLVNITPQGSQVGEKFTFAGDLEQLGATSHAKGEQTTNDIFEKMEAGAWVSCGDLAKRTSFSPSTVRSHLEKLIQAGKAEDRGEKRWKLYRRINSASELAIAGDMTNTTESKVSIASNILPFKETTQEGTAEAASKEPLPTKEVLSTDINSSPLGDVDRKTVDRKGGNE